MKQKISKKPVNKEEVGASEVSDNEEKKVFTSK